MMDHGQELCWLPTPQIQQGYTQKGTANQIQTGLHAISYILDSLAQIACPFSSQINGLDSHCSCFYNTDEPLLPTRLCVFIAQPESIVVDEPSVHDLLKML